MPNPTDRLVNPVKARMQAGDVALGLSVRMGRSADIVRVNFVMYPQETSSLTLLRYIAEAVRLIEWTEDRLAQWRDNPDWQGRHPYEDSYLTETLVRCGFGHTPPDLPSGVTTTLKGAGVPDWRQLVLERPELFDVPEPGTSGAAVGDAIEEAVNEVIARGQSS